MGIKAGFSIKLVNAPNYYFDLFTGLSADLIFNDEAASKKDIIHFFTLQKDEYIATLPVLKNEIKTNGVIWVSWSKKASGVITDITENMVRNYAIEIGLVAVKICAVDEIRSALKLVIPVKNR